MKSSIAIVCFFALCLFAVSCASVDRNNSSWPNTSFIIVGETEYCKYIGLPSDRVGSISPIVDRALLLPIMENYKWKGRVHRMAIGEPLIVEPGKQSIPAMLSALEKGRQRVSRCIILCPGYAPGALHKTWNDSSIFNGKKVWLCELAKCSRGQYIQAYAIMTNELSRTQIHVGETEVLFEDALKKHQMLCVTIMKSPIVPVGEYRERCLYSLWTVSNKTVPICISTNGYQLLTDFLRPIDDGTPLEQSAVEVEAMNVANSTIQDAEEGEHISTVQTNATIAPQLVLIPGGTFVMGDTFNEGEAFERPIHTNFISAFQIDKYEVTLGLWREVYNWAIDHGYTFSREGFGDSDNHPVWGISWYDCVKWCNARSEKEGLEPCYYLNTLHWWGVYRSGEDDLGNGYVKWTANGYRLPTEAEWEKAARGGAAGTRFPWTGDNAAQHARANYVSTNLFSYDTSPTRGSYSSFSTGGKPGASPVGSFPTNGYGVCDMAGNMYEWCWDVCDTNYYQVSPTSDPRGPSSGSARVLRGGSWHDTADLLRCANRGAGMPSFVLYEYIGFRCVRK